VISPPDDAKASFKVVSVQFTAREDENGTENKQDQTAEEQQTQKTNTYKASS
jgi:hypothetical protein